MGIARTVKIHSKHGRPLGGAFEVQEDGLIGIISLPKGCFEPYSGVKTSIIILDKISAKSFNEIFFLEIKNDGYALNKKREPIDKNDIPFVSIDLFSLTKFKFF